MPPVNDGGGGGATWNGTVQVCPGNLEASAPDFSAAGDQVNLASVPVLVWADPGGTGITDPTAAAAWSRLTHVWNKDLSTLMQKLYDLSFTLASAGGSYTATDQSVMSCHVDK